MITEAVFNNPTGTEAEQRAIVNRVIQLIDGAAAGSRVRMAMFYADDHYCGVDPVWRRDRLLADGAICGLSVVDAVRCSLQAGGMESKKQIGIVLFDGVEELDAVGPWEVLAYWTGSNPEDGYTVTTLAPNGGTVSCANRMRIIADHSFADAPALDVVLHPGGDSRRLVVDEQHLEWVRKQSSTVSLMTSVCTGSLVYAAAGLLRGRPVTTHWSAFDRLKRLDDTIEPRPDDRFVDDGDVITAAGVSAGIDMALHLVARLSSVERARQVRRGIQYDPEPPV